MRLTFSPLDKTWRAYAQAAEYSHSAKKVDWVIYSRLQALAALGYSTIGIVAYPLGAVKHLLSGELYATRTSLGNWGKSMGLTLFNVVYVVSGFFFGGCVFRWLAPSTPSIDPKTRAAVRETLERSQTRFSPSKTPHAERSAEVGAVKSAVEVVGCNVVGLRTVIAADFKQWFQEKYPQYTLQHDSTRRSMVEVPLHAILNPTVSSGTVSHSCLRIGVCRKNEVDALKKDDKKRIAKQPIIFLDEKGQISLLLTASRERRISTYDAMAQCILDQYSEPSPVLEKKIEMDRPKENNFPDPPQEYKDIGTPSRSRRLPLFMRQNGSHLSKPVIRTQSSPPRVKKLLNIFCEDLSPLKGSVPVECCNFNSPVAR